MTTKIQKTSTQANVIPDTQRQLRMKAARNLIRRYIIIGERRISNYWWAFIVLLGSSGFLLSGICSYNYNAGSSSGILFKLLPFLDFKDIDGENSFGIFSFGRNFVEFLPPFFPQGLLMSFYGS